MLNDVTSLLLFVEDISALFFELSLFLLLDSLVSSVDAANVSFLSLPTFPNTDVVTFVFVGMTRKADEEAVIRAKRLTRFVFILLSRLYQSVKQEQEEDYCICLPCVRVLCFSRII